MKQLTVIFTILTALLLATSCSKEELPGDENTDEPGQMQTYTFTVSPDLTMEGDAETRSAGTPQEMPTRCFMQIFGNNVSQDVQQSESIENGSFTFSVKLPNTTYTFLFWADNGSGDTPTDLREVQYTPGTVAFAANVQGTLETVDKTVELKHVVAKVTLKTTTDVTSEYSKNISLTASCASMYNVQEASASSFEYKSIFTEMTDEGLTANSEVLTTYIIPNPENKTVTLGAHIIPNPENKTVTLGAHEMTQAISDVPLAANTNVTLQGDLSESSSKWGNPTDAYIEKKFRSYFFDEKDNPKGYLETGTYCFDNGDVNDLTSLMKEVSRNNSFTLPTVTSLPVYISNNIYIMLMPDSITYYLYYGEITFSIMPDDEGSSYPDFSTVYPGT